MARGKKHLGNCRFRKEAPSALPGLGGLKGKGNQQKRVNSLELAGEGKIHQRPEANYNPLLKKPKGRKIRRE